MKYRIKWENPLDPIEPHLCVTFWGAGSVCSNFHEAEYSRSTEFCVPGARKLVFKSVEHDYMYHKAMYFKNPILAKRILAAKEPKDAKRLGRQVVGFNDAEWDKVKRRFMFEAKLAQANQHVYIRTYYCLNKGKRFIEASPIDPIWGVRLHANDPNIYHPRRWKGKNLLGQICDKLSHVLFDLHHQDQLNETMNSSRIVERVKEFIDIHGLDINNTLVGGLAAEVVCGPRKVTQEIDIYIDPEIFNEFENRIRQGSYVGKRFNIDNRPVIEVTGTPFQLHVDDGITDFIRYRDLLFIRPKPDTYVNEIPFIVDDRRPIEQVDKNAFMSLLGNISKHIEI